MKLKQITEQDCIVNKEAYTHDIVSKYLFVDIDGTLRYRVDNSNPLPGYAETYKVRPPFKVEEVKVFPIREKLHKWLESGYKIVGITNQSGVEEGVMSLECCREICIETTNQFGIRFPIIFAPCKKINTSIINLRKPNIGMLQLAERLYGKIDNSSILVGDYKTDIQTGERAGIRTFKVDSNLEGIDFPLP